MARDQIERPASHLDGPCRIDLWLIVGREYNEDPILPTLLAADWLSARRRTVIALHRNASGVTGYCPTRQAIGPYTSGWRADKETQHGSVRRLLLDALGPLSQRLVPA